MRVRTKCCSVHFFFSFVQLWLQMFFCLQKPSYVNQTNDKKTFWPGADQQQKIINKTSINFILRNHIVRTCFFNLMNISKLRSMCQQVNFCLYCCGNFLNNLQHAQWVQSREKNPSQNSRMMVISDDGHHPHIFHTRTNKNIPHCPCHLFYA